VTSDPSAPGPIRAPAPQYMPPPPAGYPPGPAAPPPAQYLPYGYAPPPPPPPPVTPAGQRLAEFGDRFLAFLIDYVILGAVGFVLFIPVLVYQFSLLNDLTQTLNRKYPPGSPPPDPGALFSDMFAVMLPLFGMIAVFIALTMIIRYIYQVEMMFRSGQTIGKRVMKLQVVPLEPGVPLTRGMATKRWLVESVAAAFVPFLVYLDGLWQLWDKPYRQCLHDKAARTTVIKLNP
jgi:uncharacterized RDD family membrane protein YckC